MRKIIIERESIKKLLANKVSRQLRPQARRALRLNLNGAVTVCGCCQCCGGDEDPCSCCSGNTPSSVTTTLTGVIPNVGGFIPPCAQCPNFNTTYSLFQSVPGDPSEGIPCRQGYNACYYIGTTNVTVDCGTPWTNTKTAIEILCGGGIVTVNFYICGEILGGGTTMKWTKTVSGDTFDCCSALSGLTPSPSTQGNFAGCDMSASTVTVNFSC